MKNLKSTLILLAVFTLNNYTSHAQTANFLWAAQAGGAYNDAGNSVATDGSGNSVVTGSFSGSATFGDTTLTSAGSSDMFIAKYDADGNFLWAAQAGGADQERGLDVATDGSGNSIVTGWFRSTATFGDTTLTSAGSSDMFIAKLGSGVTGIEEEFAIPRELKLYQNYPNPFNPFTMIRYDLPKTSKVILNIYNILGQKVRTLVNEEQSAGEKSADWDGRNRFGKQMSSGVYIYHLETGNYSKTRKMVLLR